MGVDDRVDRDFGQKAQSPPEGEPRPSTPRSKGRWSSRNLEKLRPDVSTNILCAHILGSNLVAWEKMQKGDSEGQSLLWEEVG